MKYAAVFHLIPGNDYYTMGRRLAYLLKDVKLCGGYSYGTIVVVRYLEGYPIWMYDDNNLDRWRIGKIIRRNKKAEFDSQYYDWEMYNTEEELIADNFDKIL